MTPRADIARTPRTLTEFEMEGRLSIRIGEERHLAGFHWRHAAGAEEVLLKTPLGQGLAELRRDSSGARLMTADQREEHAQDWEELSERLFGSRLPLDDLPSWVAGRPPPATSGWRVEYLDYQSAAPDALPVLIEAGRGDITVRLKIDEWITAR